MALYLTSLTLNHIISAKKCGSREQFSNVNVLATYQSLAPQQAAIVKCVYEKGYAILSGVHIEHATEHQNVLQHIFIELLNS